ncbi:nitroreductase family protein [Chloroflexota bacterium]
MIRDQILESRSFRRFHQDVAITEKTLRELVDLARNSATASNRQPLKFILSSDPEKNAKIFPLIGFAGQFRDWPGPAEGERPTAYIVILLDTEISKSVDCDHGIAAQSILLGAREKGLGGCMHGSAKKDELRKAINIPDKYEILLVISLGEPGEKVVLETVGPDGDIKYWRDEDSVHHVPKRTLDELIVG